MSAKNLAASGVPRIGDVEREEVVEGIAEEELFNLERINENCFLHYFLYNMVTRYRPMYTHL